MTDREQTNNAKEFAEMVPLFCKRAKVAMDIAEAAQVAPVSDDNSKDAFLDQIMVIANDGISDMGGSDSSIQVRKEVYKLMEELEEYHPEDLMLFTHTKLIKLLTTGRKEAKEALKTGPAGIETWCELILKPTEDALSTMRQILMK